MERAPFGPATSQTAPAAISAGTLSAAGEPLQRLPPSEARPCIWVEPISSNASTTPGHAAFTVSSLPSVAPETAAPTRISSPFTVTSMSAGMRFKSTMRPGRTKSVRS